MSDIKPYHEMQSNPKVMQYVIGEVQSEKEHLIELEKTAIRMEELAKLQDGYLGIESTRNKIGITVSYWKDLASITKWKKQYRTYRG